MKEREVRIRFKNDFPFFAHNCLKIRPKEGEIRDFRLNKAQRYIHEKIEAQKKEKGFVRAIILKGRQQGCSTYVGGRFFWKVIHSKGIKSFILTHRADATDNLFKMTQRFYQYLPDQLKPFVDRKNAKELSFTTLDSGYKVGTASAGSVGRSDTIQLFHGSEVAFWDSADEIVSGILQAIPRQSEIIQESTGNGEGNYFHEQWKLAEKGESDFIPIFIPSFWQDEYQCALDEKFTLSEEEREIRDLYGLTNEQMYWRQKKIGELGEISLFKQEYPFNATEAFQASAINKFIEPILVQKARKNTEAKPYGPLIMGVDPARNSGAGDDTAIIFRQGRVAFDLMSFKTNDLMDIVGIVHKLIRDKNPDAVCIDVIGLGAGVVDRLRELGYGKIVKAINVTEKAYNRQKYKNIKTEMWGSMKEWLLDYPCKIPDDDALQTDLCTINYKFTSNAQLNVLNFFELESKQSLKSRGCDSPDRGEALGLTFACPIIKQASIIKPYSTVANIWAQ
jgi:hypothetical protein